MTLKLTAEQHQALNGREVPIAAEDEETLRVYYLVDAGMLESLRHEADMAPLLRGIADAEGGRYSTLSDAMWQIEARLRSRFKACLLIAVCALLVGISHTSSVQGQPLLPAGGSVAPKAPWIVPVKPAPAITVPSGVPDPYGLLRKAEGLARAGSRDQSAFWELMEVCYFQILVGDQVGATSTLSDLEAAARSPAGTTWQLITASQLYAFAGDRASAIRILRELGDAVTKPMGESTQEAVVDVLSIAGAQSGIGDDAGARQTLRPAVKIANALPTDDGKRDWWLHVTGEAQLDAGDLGGALTTSWMLAADDSYAFSNVIAARQAKDGDIAGAFRTAHQCGQVISDANYAIAPAQAVSGDLLGALITVQFVFDPFSQDDCYVEIVKAYAARRDFSAALATVRWINGPEWEIDALMSIFRGQLAAGDKSSSRATIQFVAEESRRWCQSPRNWEYGNWMTIAVDVAMAQSSVGESAGARKTIEDAIAVIVSHRRDAWKLCVERIVAAAEAGSAVGDSRGAAAALKQVALVATNNPIPPSSGPAVVSLGLALAKIGDKAAARDAFKATADAAMHMDGYARGQGLGSAATCEHIDSISLLLRVAHAHAAIGDSAAASAAASQILRAIRASTDRRVPKVGWLQELASVYAAAGDYVAARDILHELDPDEFHRYCCRFNYLDCQSALRELTRQKQYALALEVAAKANACYAYLAIATEIFRSRGVNREFDGIGRRLNEREVYTETVKK